MENTIRCPAKGLSRILTQYRFKAKSVEFPLKLQISKFCNAILQPNNVYKNACIGVDKDGDISENSTPKYSILGEISW